MGGGGAPQALSASMLPLATVLQCECVWLCCDWSMKPTRGGASRRTCALPTFTLGSLPPALLAIQTAFLSLA